MKVVKIIRISDDGMQTLGALSVNFSDFTCKTLELPFKNNAKRVSCIPKGEYECVWSLSPAMQTFHYEIKNVPGRSGIRIHAANFVEQLLGCIALGSEIKDMNMDKRGDLYHSGNTIEAFEELMNHETFKLIIT